MLLICHYLDANYDLTESNLRKIILKPLRYTVLPLPKVIKTNFSSYAINAF